MGGTLILVDIGVTLGSDISGVALGMTGVLLDA